MVRPRASNRPKLLFTVNDAGFFLSHRLAIARAAAAAGYDVAVATAPGPATRRIVECGLAHHPVPISRRGLSPWREARAVWSLYRLYRRERPDLVHHVTIKPVLYGGIAARLAGVPAVVSAISGLGYLFVERGPASAIVRALVRLIYRVALRRHGSRVIFQNPDDRREFIEQGLVAPDACVLIKGSGVDTAAFAPRPESTGAPLVVLPARMLWDKGVGEFVEAARRLRAQGVPARFALVGDSDDGNPSAVPTARLQAWQAEGVVEWWGFRDDMAQVLAQAHVVCLPSYREGLPKSLIEAAASGRAIVATDVPGCREIARDGETALLVPARDPASLAAALRRLLEDPGLRRRLGARGRAIAVAEFSLERVVAETLAAYAAVLDEAGGRGPVAAPDNRIPCRPG